MARTFDMVALAQARARITLTLDNLDGRTASRRRIDDMDKFAVCDQDLVVIAARKDETRKLVRKAAAAYHANEIALAISAYERTQMVRIAGEEGRRFAIAHRKLSAAPVEPDRDFQIRFNRTMKAMEAILRDKLSGQFSPDDALGACFDMALEDQRMPVAS